VYEKVSPESASVVVKVPITAATAFSTTSLLDKVMSVGAVLVGVGVGVGVGVVVPPPTPPHAVKPNKAMNSALASEECFCNDMNPNPILM
jgi:hypothetical protein